jgi:MinD superfamily P-loop ATPase
LNYKIAIASGKGGTGKTFVATNMFYALAINDYKPILIDCDAEQPNSMVFFDATKVSSQPVTLKIPKIDAVKCKFCGKCYDYCNFNSIFYLPSAKKIHIMEDMCHSCGACVYACKYRAISENDISIGEINNYIYLDKYQIIEAQTRVGTYNIVPVIKAATKYGNNHNLVILDSPPGTSCPFIHTVREVDYVILVTEPTPFGVSDLIQSVETLKILGKKYGVIINRSNIGDQQVYEYLKCEKIPLLMEIPYSKEIAKDYSNGDLYVKQDKALEKQFLLMINKLLA